MAAPVRQAHCAPGQRVFSDREPRAPQGRPQTASRQLGWRVRCSVSQTLAGLIRLEINTVGNFNISGYCTRDNRKNIYKSQRDDWEYVYFCAADNSDNSFTEPSLLLYNKGSCLFRCCSHLLLKREHYPCSRHSTQWQLTSNRRLRCWKVLWMVPYSDQKLDANGL